MRWEAGQRVRSTVTAQGLRKGAEYIVCNVITRYAFAFRYTELELVAAADDRSGAHLWVGNPHLVLSVLS